MRWALVGTITALGVILLAGPAAAKMTLEVVSPGTRIEPGAEVEEVPFKLTIPCQEGVRNAPPANQQAVVSIVPTAGHDGIMLSGTTSYPVSFQSCLSNPTGSVVTDGKYLASASRSTPGLVPIPFSLQARLPASSAAGTELTAEANGTIVAAYFPLIQVKGETKVIEISPGATGRLLLTVTNLGNAETTVVVARSSELATGLATELPSALIIAQGASAEVEIQIRTTDSPGFDNREAQFEFLFTPHATADETAKGPPTQFNALVRVRSSAVGGEAAAPAVGPIFAMLLLLVAAVAARRRE